MNSGLDREFEQFLERNIDAVWAPPSEPNSADAWRRFSAEVGKKHSRPALQRWTLGFGALVPAVIIAFVAIKYIPPTVPADQSKTYTTAPTQRATITLSEGSTVILAPASRMTVSGRTMDLSGEAIFTVSPKQNNPFIVRTSDATTRVLGTTFAVRAYGATRVAVAEGKVSIGETVLAAGDVARVNGGKITVVRDTAVAAFVSWTTGKLVYDRAPYTEVAADFARWYDVKLQPDSAITGQRITLTLDGYDRNRALEALAFVLGARTERNGQIIKLHTQNPGDSR